MFTVNKLKISGFKSFAQPTELLIENGVTGIIGPNGCGKSNIFEAIRWVMGESSSKSLRSGTMDDVIFNGTQNIPAKNYAEVSLELDEFEDISQTLKITEKKIHVTRILERGVGSFFKINNRDVRAKDVSVLFYDSGSGPRSSSIISQGNIDQVINYKPIERKIILEDAAGISGLQARRRESELKLQSTDLNLEKVEINLNNLLEQKRNLSRQARQAETYENLSQTIKFYQSLIIFSEWSEIKTKLDESLQQVTNLNSEMKKLIDDSKNQKQRVSTLKESFYKIQEVGNEINKKLFEKKNLQNALINKLELVKNKKEEIRKFLKTIINDKQNEHKILSDLENYIKTAEVKLLELADDQKNQKKLNILSGEETDLRNQIKQIESIYVNEMQLTLGDEFKSDNLKEEKDNLKKEEEVSLKEIKILDESTKKNKKTLDFEDNFFQKLIIDKKKSEKKIDFFKISIQEDQKKLNLNKQSLRKIDFDIELNLKKFTETNTEIKTLNKLIGDANISKESIINLIKIKSGYENAIFAALMYELDATLDKRSSKKWVKKKMEIIQTIKNPLSNFVEAPNELNLILSQIGFIEKKENALEEQKQLKIGQMLVDKDGNIWRWDGFISHENLQNKKIIDSQIKKNELEKTSKLLNKKLETLKKSGDSFKRTNENLEQNISLRNKELESLYKSLDVIIVKISNQKEKITHINYTIQIEQQKVKELKDNISNIFSKLKDIKEKEDLLTKNFGNIKDEKRDFEKKITELDEKIEIKRKEINSIRELIMKNELDKSYLINDIKKSKNNLLESKKRIEKFNEREKGYLLEEKKLENLPTEIQSKINNYQGEYNSLNNELKKNKYLSEESSNELKKLEERLSQTEYKRENQRNEITKLDGVLDNLKSKEKELRSLIFERSKKQPEEIENDDVFSKYKQKTHIEIKNELEKLNFQREQMGPVNLRARIEEQEIQSYIDELELEKNDLYDALQKLRQAINKINQEGKNRLLKAFEKVNKNFSDLFTKLFNGGEAKIELVKSDDPLQTGLDIFARPPGKKLSNITLLSGGEKTLTAIALIFSIFLINPSPICILDEVDAALDDVNVEKFCHILNELKKNTKTKFLIITHNKITMSSIDRIYGVTMAQKGISDIVSVDLKKIDLQEAI